MKVFRWSNFKDIKNTIFGVVIIFICLFDLRVYADKTDVKIKAFDVSSTSNVQEIYRNSEATKYKITLLDKIIYKVTDMNGEKITPEQLSGKSVLFSNNGLNKVRVYSSSSNYEVVDLESDEVMVDITSPKVLWKYKNNGDNLLWLEIEDESGLYEIRKNNQVGSLRTIFTGMQKKAILSIELAEGEILERLEISDIFGNTEVIEVSEITLNVVEAFKNANGSVIVLKLNDSENNITGLEYLDGTEIESVSGTDLEKTYNVAPGTTKIKVKFGDEYAIIQLDTDAKSPEIVRVWKKGDNSRMLLETKDYESGVKKIAFYNKSTKNEQVYKEFEGLHIGGVSQYDIMEGATHLYVYDGVGNRTKVAMTSIGVDDEGPVIVVRYKDGKYIMTVREEKSGIDTVRLDGIDVDTYIDYPAGEFVYTYDDLNGDSYITASDGLGYAVSLTVDEAISIRKRIYKNDQGDIISIKLEDDRGIQKITDQDGNIIERFLLNEKEISGVYKVRSDIDSIKVFYQDNKCYNIRLQELSEKPQISNEVYDDELITECVVSSKAGIKKIEYRDGRSIEFKENIPDDIIVNCTELNDDSLVVPAFVTVYDALDNSVNINESLMD